MKAMAGGMGLFWAVLFLCAASAVGTPLPAKNVQGSLNAIQDHVDHLAAKPGAKPGDNIADIDMLQAKLDSLKRHIDKYEAKYGFKNKNKPFGSVGDPCGSDSDCGKMTQCVGNTCQKTRRVDAPGKAKSKDTAPGKAKSKDTATGAHHNAATGAHKSTAPNTASNDGINVEIGSAHSSHSTFPVHITKSGYVAALAVGMSFVASLMLGLICCWLSGYRGCARGEGGGCGCRARQDTSRYGNKFKNAASQQNLLEMAQSEDIDEAAECVLDLTGVNAEDNSLQPVALGSVHMTWSSQSTLSSEPDHVDLSVMPDDTDDDSSDEGQRFVSRRFSAY